MVFPNETPAAGPSHDRANPFRALRRSRPTNKAAARSPETSDSSTSSTVFEHHPRHMSPLRTSHSFLRSDCRYYYNSDTYRSISRSCTRVHYFRSLTFRGRIVRPVSVRVPISTVSRGPPDDIFPRFLATENSSFAVRFGAKFVRLGQFKSFRQRRFLDVDTVNSDNPNPCITRSILNRFTFRLRRSIRLVDTFNSIPPLMGVRRLQRKIQKPFSIRISEKCSHDRDCI